jgi:hypothetical protein
MAVSDAEGVSRVDAWQWPGGGEWRDKSRRFWLPNFDCRARGRSCDSYTPGFLGVTGREEKRGNHVPFGSLPFLSFPFISSYFPSIF